MVRTHPPPVKKRIQRIANKIDNNPVWGLEGCKLFPQTDNTRNTTHKQQRHNQTHIIHPIPLNVYFHTDNATVQHNETHTSMEQNGTHTIFLQRDALRRQRWWRSSSWQYPVYYILLLAPSTRSLCACLRRFNTYVCIYIYIVYAENVFTVWVTFCRFRCQTQCFKNVLCHSDRERERERQCVCECVFVCSEAPAAPWPPYLYVRRLFVHSFVRPSVVQRCDADAEIVLCYNLTTT